MKAAKLLLLGIPFLCVCCALGLASASAQMQVGYRGEYGYGSGPGESAPPEGGACSNAGAAYSDNPFRGWPLDYRQDWGVITFFFCNLYPDGTPHWGIDFGVPVGTEVFVTAQRAVVRQAHGCGEEPNCWNSGMGRYVQAEAQTPAPDYDQCVADHGGDPEADACWAGTGWVATYMHLDEVRAYAGQIVRRGEILGTTGNSGNSTGPHLHYQINSPSAGAVDPAPTLTGG